MKKDVKDLKILFSKEQVLNRTKELAEEINKDFGTDEDLTVIDKAVADSAKSAYLMIVAVSRARRNSGIASKLIEAFSDVYAGCDIVTDVVSESMEHLCKKYGFEKYGTAADCSVYLRKADFLH